MELVWDINNTIAFELNNIINIKNKSCHPSARYLFRHRFNSRIVFPCEKIYFSKAFHLNFYLTLESRCSTSHCAILCLWKKKRRNIRTAGQKKNIKYTKLSFSKAHYQTRQCHHRVAMSHYYTWLIIWISKQILTA